MNDKIGATELNEPTLNSMPNIWYRQAYVQGFDCESIDFKKYFNLFEHMEISGSIYEGVVETSYKKSTRADANRDVNRREKNRRSRLFVDSP